MCVYMCNVYSKYGNYLIILLPVEAIGGVITARFTIRRALLPINMIFFYLFLFSIFLSSLATGECKYNYVCMMNIYIMQY